MKFVKKAKRPLAIWRTAFPDQAKALRPENTLAGGVKARSVPESVRMAVYRPLAEMFKTLNPWCRACSIIPLTFKVTVSVNGSKVAVVVRPTRAVHHKRGRDGLLLFDSRYWLPVCNECHEWIGSHIYEARKLKLIADSGDWRKAAE